MPQREDYDIVLTARNGLSAGIASAKNDLRGLDTFTKGLSIFSGGLIGGLTAGALGKFVADSVGAAAALGRVAKMSGFTADEIQGLNRAMKDGGGDFADGEKAARRFADALGDAANRTGPLYDFLIRNNVAVRDSAGNLRRTSEVFADYIQLVSRIRDPQQQLNVLTDTFGKENAPAVAASLTNVNRSLDFYVQKMREAGGVTKQQIEDSQALKREFDDLVEKGKTWAMQGALGISKWIGSAVQSVRSAIGDPQAIRAEIDRLQREISALVDKQPAKVFEPIVEAKLKELEALQKRLADMGGAKTAITINGPRQGVDDFLFGQINGRATNVGNPLEDKAQRTLQDLTRERGMLMAIGAERRELVIAEQTVQALRKAGFSDLEIEKGLIGDIGEKIKERVRGTEMLRERLSAISDATAFWGQQFVGVLDRMFEKGTKFSDVLRDIGKAATSAAANALFLGTGPFAGLFGTSNSGGGFGLMAKLFAGSPANATGGSYMVGGGGGVDSKLATLRVTPGERIDVTPPGGGGSGQVVYAPQYHFSNVSAADRAALRNEMMQIAESNRGTTINDIRRLLRNDSRALQG